MEYLNMLIENSSRFVFEARTIIKRSFDKVEDFFNYYKLKNESNIFGKKGGQSNNYYSPSMDL